MTTSLRRLLEQEAQRTKRSPAPLDDVLSGGGSVVRRRRVVGIAIAAAAALIAVVVPWAIVGAGSDTEQPIEGPRCETPWLSGADQSSSETGTLAWISADLSESTSLYEDAANIPVVSPDGSRIAFEQMGGDQTAGAYTRSALKVIDADGSDVRALTDGRRYDGDAAWSPDGRRIAFVSGRYLSGANRWGPSQLRVVDADGTDERIIELTASVGDELAWLDRDSLLYQHDHVVWRVDLDRPEPVTPRRVGGFEGALDEGPDPYSPDRTAVVTIAEDAGHPFRYHLEITDLATGRTQPVPESSNVDATLGWTRDGDLVFLRTVRDRGSVEAYEIWATADEGWGDSSRLLRRSFTGDEPWPYALNPSCPLPE